MSYFELLKLASPEAIVVLTALIVLTIGLATGRSTVAAAVSAAETQKPVGDSPVTVATTSGLCSFVAALGLVLSAGAIFILPQHAALFHGMLVITPLNSLFKIISLALAFFTIIVARGDRMLPNRGEYLGMILLGTTGLMLLVGSEELLMIFIGLELTGLSLYILTAFDKSDIRSAEAGLKYFLFGSNRSPRATITVKNARARQMILKREFSGLITSIP